MTHIYVSCFLFDCFECLRRFHLAREGSSPQTRTIFWAGTATLPTRMCPRPIRTCRPTPTYVSASMFRRPRLLTVDGEYSSVTFVCAVSLFGPVARRDGETGKRDYVWFSQVKIHIAAPYGSFHDYSFSWKDSNMPVLPSWPAIASHNRFAHTRVSRSLISTMCGLRLVHLIVLLDWRSARLRGKLTTQCNWRSTRIALFYPLIGSRVLTSRVATRVAAAAAWICVVAQPPIWNSQVRCAPSWSMIDPTQR